jgi:hypothetical protein
MVQTVLTLPPGTVPSPIWQPPTSPVRARQRRSRGMAPPLARPCRPRGASDHLPVRSGPPPFPPPCVAAIAGPPPSHTPCPLLNGQSSSGVDPPNQISPARRLIRPPSAAALTVCPSRPTAAPPSTQGPSGSLLPFAAITGEAPSSCRSSPIPGCETHSRPTRATGPPRGHRHSPVFPVAD